MYVYTSANVMSCRHYVGSPMILIQWYFWPPEALQNFLNYGYYTSQNCFTTRASSHLFSRRHANHTQESGGNCAQQIMSKPIKTQKYEMTRMLKLVFVCDFQIQPALQYLRKQMVQVKDTENIVEI